VGAVESQGFLLTLHL